MKAYIIRISLINTEPLIWRKVLVPSCITFKTLHDIIQFSMGWNNKFHYDFEIVEENIRITNDEETILEYEHYSRMDLNERNDPHGYVTKMLKTKLRSSSNCKIDEYFNKYNKIMYIYDFGDYWKHDIIIEKVIDNCEDFLPNCLEGEGQCPPEDIGGTDIFNVFLKAFNAPNHPKYKEMKKWAEFHQYNGILNLEDINDFMKELYKLKGFN